MLCISFFHQAPQTLPSIAGTRYRYKAPLMSPFDFIKAFRATTLKITKKEKKMPEEMDDAEQPEKCNWRFSIKCHKAAILFWAHTSLIKSDNIWFLKQKKRISWFKKEIFLIDHRKYVLILQPYFNNIWMWHEVSKVGVVLVK